MTIRIGVAGLGTVGGALLSILVEDRRFSAMGFGFVISGVSARNRDRPRPAPIDEYRWFDDPIALAKDPETDVFVELIGGAEGTAREAVEAALTSGKAVVTANKALIAAHSKELAEMAEAHGGSLLYEAAVAGGTPVVRGIGTSAAACRIHGIAGILNGTCNFILDQMSAHGAAYEDALKEAQDVGYAEADPSFDVDGRDAAQKLAILSTLGLDGLVEEEQMDVRGISQISAEDITAAKYLHTVIKLVAEMRLVDGQPAFRVAPNFVATGHVFSTAKGAGNAVRVQADPLGELMFTGPGAGAGATASAVAADLCDIARGLKGPVFSVPAARLAPLNVAPHGTFTDSYVLRTGGQYDATVREVLKAEGIAVESVQLVEGAGTVVVTGPTKEAMITKVASSLSAQLGETVSIFPIIEE